MTPRIRRPALSALLAGALLAALTVGPSASARTAATPTRGGDIVIARTLDSTSMDNTSVFDNESIWVFENMLEPLYTVTPDGKDVKPWLATSYTLSKDKKTYVFQLRKGVKFHNGAEMTSADVKFSLDAARTTKGGWGYIDAAIASVTPKGKYAVVVKTKYPWAPLVADIALFSNAIVPKNYGGKTKKQFYTAPVAGCRQVPTGACRTASSSCRRSSWARSRSRRTARCHHHGAHGYFVLTTRRAWPLQ